MRRGWPLVAALPLACTESATSVIRRFPVLDDEGQSNWTAVSVGHDHTCATKTGGVAYCWGTNLRGQLGTARVDTLCGLKDATFPCVITPARVETTIRFQSLSAGGAHTCGIAESGDAYCWGSNSDAQLGNFSSGGPSVARVPGVVAWSQISAGETHSCGVRADGALYCWGANDRGQIGSGAASGAVPPTRVALPEMAAGVSAGLQ